MVVFYYLLIILKIAVFQSLVSKFHNQNGKSMIKSFGWFFVLVVRSLLQFPDLAVDRILVDVPL